MAAGEGFECAGFSRAGSGQGLGPLALFLSPVGFIQTPGELACPWSRTIPAGLPGLPEQAFQVSSLRGVGGCVDGPQWGSQE